MLITMSSERDSCLSLRSASAYVAERMVLVVQPSRLSGHGRELLKDIAGHYRVSALKSSWHMYRGRVLLRPIHVSSVSWSLRHDRRNIVPRRAG